MVIVQTVDAEITAVETVLQRERKIKKFSPEL